jgi:hypothetical protein
MTNSLWGACRAPAGALALALTLLAGCGGSSGGGTSAPAPAATQNAAPVATLALAGQVTSAAGSGDAATYTGADIRFDASASTDPEGDALAFSWTLTSKPATSAAAVKGSGAVVTVTPDTAGTYVVTVRITDSKGAFTDKQATMIVAANAAPVSSVAISASYSAVTATDAVRNVTVGASILLDSAGSKDADGDTVTTSWELIARPAGSLAVLATSGQAARLNTDVAGSYKVRARGMDPSGAFSETVYPFEAVGAAPRVVVVASVDTTPRDDGTSSIKGTVGYTLSLSSAGANPDRLALGYAWTLVSKPAGSSAVLDAGGSAFTQLTPDVLGDYVVKLLVTTPDGAASSHTTTVSVANRRPAAAIASNATPVALPSGPTLRLPLNSTVTLRGTSSVDADGDTLSYLWSLDGKPAGSTTVLSASDTPTVQLTTDMAGSYAVSLRVTDPSGAYSVQTITVASGNSAPVAVIDKSRLTVYAELAANLHANFSFDDDGDALTFAWALDAKPAASALSLSARTPQLVFTPDVEGTYVLSVTVSDGKASSVAYVNVVALIGAVRQTTLPFTPLISRYSKGLDRFVSVSSGPDMLNIVDPFTAALRQVPLPGAVKDMNVSPNGKLAVVLHEGTISLVDLQTPTLLRSSSTNGTQSAAFVSNDGVVYLTGQSPASYSSAQVYVINGRTGVDLSATLGSTNTGASFSGSTTGVYSPLKRTAYLSAPYSTSEVYSYTVGTTGIASKLATTGTRYDYTSPAPFFLNTTEDLLFTSNGNFFRTETMKYAGKLVLANTIVALSQSDVADEALVVTAANGAYNGTTGTYGRLYEAQYHRFTGSLYYAAEDIALPVIAGAQSYGLGVYHSANNNRIALVQTGGANSTDVGLKYFLLRR